jgi:hypothetical protein
VEEDGQLKIARLAAHWPARRTSLRGLARGFTGLRTVTGQTGRMVHHLGLGGAAGYAWGLGAGIFARGPARLARFVAAVNHAAASLDTSGLEALCVPGGPILQHPSAPAPSLPSLVRALTTPGPFQVETPIATGHAVAFGFSCGPGPDGPRGLGVLGLQPRTGRVASARFFLAAPGAGR